MGAIRRSGNDCLSILKYGDLLQNIFRSTDYRFNFIRIDKTCWLLTSTSAPFSPSDPGSAQSLSLSRSTDTGRKIRSSSSSLVSLNSGVLLSSLFLFLRGFVCTRGSFLSLSGVVNPSFWHILMRLSSSQTSCLDGVSSLSRCFLNFILHDSLSSLFGVVIPPALEICSTDDIFLQLSD